jgi:uncharacterized protein
VIVYLDSSALVRSYLTDEPGSASIRAMIHDSSVATISGSWTRVETIGAFVRAARTGRFAFDELEEALSRDSSPDGGLVFVDTQQSEIELIALGLVREYGLRAMDAWQLACANLAFEALADPREERAFATRDAEQALVAKHWGYTAL